MSYVLYISPLKSEAAISPTWSLLIFISLCIGVYLIFHFKVWRVFTSGYRKSQKAQVEDILKQLYHVEQSERNASILGLSGALGISGKRMIELIENMTASGLIGTTGENIRLTDAGRDYALKIIRVHRLWEKYLSEHTGIDKLEWHDRAEYKEHILTPEQTEELYQELGRPRFDPHGDPIPTEQGHIVEIKNKPLPSLAEGTIARISHIEDEPEAVYEQIIAKKLHIGSQLKVITSNDTHVIFYCEGNEYTLSTIVASNISVRELNKQEIFEEDKVRLSSLKEGESAVVKGISSECRGAARRRSIHCRQFKMNYPITF